QERDRPERVDVDVPVGPGPRERDVLPLVLEAQLGQEEPHLHGVARRRVGVEDEAHPATTSAVTRSPIWTEIAWQTGQWASASAMSFRPSGSGAGDATRVWSSASERWWPSSVPHASLVETRVSI